MKKSGTVLIVIVGIVVLIAVMLISGYNGLISKRESVTTAFSNMDVYLQRRVDIIPNYLNLINAYMNHETNIINSITASREKIVGANTVEEKVSANNELTKALTSLNVIVENYPDLKSSEEFKGLQDELVGAENRIATVRIDYNAAAKEYNTAIKRFPANIYANIFGFETAKYFEADDSSQEVPNVSFE